MNGDEALRIEEDLTVKKLRVQDYREMPWKSGKGTTHQIAISPEGADFTKESFLWRVSTAPMIEDGVFSHFPGYERILMVVQGEGLLLNRRILSPFETVRFSGNETMNAKLISGPILDLGVIHDPEKVKVDLQFIPNLRSETVFSFSTGTHFVYCIQGTMRVNGELVGEGESIRFDESEGFNVTIGFDVSGSGVHVSLTD